MINLELKNEKSMSEIENRNPNDYEFGLSPEQFRAYFIHVLGVNFLNVWLSEQSNSLKFDVDRNEAILDLYASNRFYLISPRRNERFYALGGERDILNWLGRINWSRVVLNPFTRTISFASKRMDGDKKRLPDIEVFTLTFKFDSLKKLKCLKNERFLNIKEIFFEDATMIISAPKVKKLPIVLITEQAETYHIYTREETLPVTTTEDIKRGTVQRKNSVFSSIFKGDVGHIPGNLAWMTKPFNESSVNEGLKAYGESIKSSSYLAEFAKKEYDYGDWYEQNIAANEEDRHKNNQKFASMWD